MTAAPRPAKLGPRTLSDLASWQLAQAALSAQRLTARRFAVLGMRRQHFSVLQTLAEGGPASQAALGRRLSIDRSDMVAAINELEQAGLVRRSRDVHDRRRNLVGLTPAGVFALRQLNAHVSEAEEELLAPLSSAERRQLDRLLTRIVEHHTARQQPDH